MDETLATLGADGHTLLREGVLGPQTHPSTTTRVVPYNDLDALERALQHNDVACMLMEPALTNIGIVLPKPGYLDGVRALTRRYGVLLIIDETHTICAGPGGCTKVEEERKRRKEKRKKENDEVEGDEGMELEHHMSGVIIFILFFI